LVRETTYLERPEPKLRDEDVDAFLETVRKTDRLDWLMFRLIIECGLSPDEVVGNTRNGADLKGIFIADLTDTGIFLRRGHQRNKVEVHASAELLKRLQDLAGERSGKLFVTGWNDASRLGQEAKQYAQLAQIPGYENIRIQTLRNYYSRNSLTIPP